jgi:hypothetical protein
LTARVSGLSPAAARLLARLDGRGLWLGGKRSQGMGRCKVTVTKGDAGAGIQAVEDAVALGEELRRGWQAIERAAGRELSLPLREGEAALAIVLDEPWCPAATSGSASSAGSAGGAGPDELGQGPLSSEEVREPIARFLELSEESRFGAVEARRYGGVDLDGEKPPVRAVAPGSVFVYAVTRGELSARLAEWLTHGERGTGLHRELGWGRFRPWTHPISTAEETDTMDTQASATQRTRQQAVNAEKAWLVQTGDQIGELAKDTKEWSSQLRAVWEAARTENEPAVVINLLRYQRARNRNWLVPRDLFNPLKGAMESCIQKAHGDTDLALDLIRHLLVYTIRAYTYHDKLREEPRP